MGYYRRQRRSRFTVTMADQVKDVILAYTADSAREYYERRGHTVLSVEKGDYRLQEKMSNEGFKIDQKALKEAIEFFGLKLPVKIKVTNHQGGRMGAHSFRPARGKFMRNPDLDTASGGMYHHITIKGWLSADEAGKTLWHELTHAMQAERETADAVTMRDQFNGWKFCAARDRGIRYQHKSIEVEAREHEILNESTPLAIVSR